jgi:hypothetical protein
MTDPIQRLREAHEAATPGRWVMAGAADARSADVFGPDGDAFIEVRWNPGRDNDPESDAEAIVLAHNALPALLDVAEAARVAVRWPCTGGHPECDEHRRLRAALDRLEEVGS